MSSLRHTHSNPFNGQIGMLQTEKNEVNPVASGLPLGNQTHIASACQCCLKHETMSATGMAANFFEHQTPGAHCDRGRVKGESPAAVNSALTTQCGHSNRARSFANTPNSRAFAYRATTSAASA